MCVTCLRAAVRMGRFGCRAVRVARAGALEIGDARAGDRFAGQFAARNRIGGSVGTKPQSPAGGDTAPVPHPFFGRALPRNFPEMPKNKRRNPFRGVPAFFCRAKPMSVFCACSPVFALRVAGGRGGALFSRCLARGGGWSGSGFDRCIVFFVDVCGRVSGSCLIGRGCGWRTEFGKGQRRMSGRRGCRERRGRHVCRADVRGRADVRTEIRDAVGGLRGCVRVRFAAGGACLSSARCGRSLCRERPVSLPGTAGLSVGNGWSGAGRSIGVGRIGRSIRDGAEPMLRMFEPKSAYSAGRSFILYKTMIYIA